jgi:dTMP kinase
MRRRELDRFERAGPEFHARVRAGFREMAAANPERWVVIDGEGKVDVVAGRLRDAVRERLGI